MTTTAANFAGLHVAALESRHADDMARLIERLGGVPHVSPSMREVPLANNRPAVEFANRLMTGQVDVVIFMTGVGVRHLADQLRRQVDFDRFLASLADITTIVRGPKPVAALHELGLKPSLRVPEPNTWREVLQTIDAHLSLANQVVGLQEYGVPNPSLVAGLEARGAEVLNLKVYDWDLPEDTEPLAGNVRAMVAGEIDVALFTSATQVAHLLEMARRLDLEDALQAALRRMVIASIGPTTTEALRDSGIPVDLAPSHPKMGHLVNETAAQAADTLRRKREVARVIEPGSSVPVDTSAPYHNSLFLRACRQEAVERTPIWLMRQAGRYMAEYRKIRQSMSFLELCKNPQLCSQVMVEAVERLGVDAAIVFSDLLPILEPMGMELRFQQGDGPIIDNPLREAGDIDRFLELESVDALHFVTEAVRQTRTDLPEEIPLIGFAGAPFTLASYAIEGGASRNFLFTKTLMYRDRGAWDALMERLARAVALYLNAQIAAGAQAVQLFDSWVGCLGPDDYRRFVLPHVRSLIGALRPGVPVIHFAIGNPMLLPLLREAGGSVIGVDWRIRLDDAWQSIGYDRAVQGNLDPLVLLADEAEIRRRAGEVLDQAAGRPGHIFNLGHGVLQQTPVESVIALVRAVQELSSRP
ncbi:MAG: uroporphyrinogen decarboxylase [Pirellulales bacterium]